MGVKNAKKIFIQFNKKEIACKLANGFEEIFNKFGCSKFSEFCI